MITFQNRLLALSSAIVLGIGSLSAQFIRPVEGSQDGLPFQMETVSVPQFAEYSVNIKDFGAVPDGRTLCTEAINKAIQTVNAKGGGTVVIPEGFWLTGPITLLSNVNLYTERNALVYFTPDHTQYPIILTNFEGLETRRCASPLNAKGAENIAVTGYGIFDGNGDTWRAVKKSKMTESQWKKLVASGGVVEGTNWYPSAGSLKGKNACKSFNVPEGINTEEEWNEIRDWLRPVLLSFQNCKKVLLQGVTFRNSPSWCLHPLMCEDLTIDQVSVSNPWYAQNGDALDVESCNRVHILNSIFDAGDDAICLKSGKDEQGRRRGIPTQNVICRNNTVLHGHGGFVVGSEMSGGVKNVLVQHCSFLGTDVGLRFKSTRGRGGVVENIHCDHINMVNIPGEAILFDLYYGGKDPLTAAEEGQGDQQPQIPPVTEETPVFRDIYIDHVNVSGAGKAMYFNGLPEMRIKNVNLTDVTISEAKQGAIFRQSEDITLKNVNVYPLKGEAIQLENVKNISINGVHTAEVKGKQILK